MNIKRTIIRLSIVVGNKFFKEIKMDEIIKGLQWIKENQAYGVSGACDDLIEKCKKLTSDNSDSAKCEHKNIVPGDDLFICDDCKRVVKVTAHFV
jgi:hypothetical protein